jgi:hypothetical protein
VSDHARSSDAMGVLMSQDMHRLGERERDRESVCV